MDGRIRQFGPESFAKKLSIATSTNNIEYSNITLATKIQSQFIQIRSCTFPISSPPILHKSQ